MPKEATKTAAAVEEKPKKAAKEEGPKMLNTRELADMFSTKPATLRRFLRTLPSHQDKQYTRYAWDPNDKRTIEDLRTSFGRYKEKESAKNKERLENLKNKDKKGAEAPAQEGKGAKKKVTEIS